MHQASLTFAPENKVVFCTGGNGSICSAQVRALVHLGAEACIVGRNGEKTERIAKDIATARPGAKVIGIGSVDVRDIDTLQKAADMCVEQLGRIDFCMYGYSILQRKQYKSLMILLEPAQQVISSPLCLNSQPMLSRL